MCPVMMSKGPSCFTKSCTFYLECTWIKSNPSLTKLIAVSLFLDYTNCVKCLQLRKCDLTEIIKSSRRTWLTYDLYTFSCSSSKWVNTWSCRELRYDPTWGYVGITNAALSPWLQLSRVQVSWYDHSSDCILDQWNDIYSVFLYKWCWKFSFSCVS